MTPALNGDSKSVESKQRLPKGVTNNGDRNCPRYNAMESKGMTVEAAYLPAFIEAMVFR